LELVEVIGHFLFIMILFPVYDDDDDDDDDMEPG
jgi:hypothetical protein